MFGNLASWVHPLAQKRLAMEDVPPPTPVSLPRYQPFAQDDAPVEIEKALSNLLKSTGRSTAALGSLGLSAIGLDLKLDAQAEDMIPDPSHIPDFEKWESLSPDEAQAQSEVSRKLLRTGARSPGCLIYLERHRELSNDNLDAFRNVRRIPPPKGKRQPRLGNAYEFFRCLELFTSFWDDPTQPPPMPPSPELSAPEKTPPLGDAQDQTAAATPEREPLKYTIMRTAEGGAMPPEFRTHLTLAFIKFVSYDFGCNVAMARTEPRLHLSSPQGHPQPRRSYTASNCQFIFQSPTSREEARAGLIYGPVAAVSVRPTVDFATPDAETAQSLDLAREVVAGLIAAQHRAREGKTEKGFGDGLWWATKPRWGGGLGGPIGREMEKDALQGDKEGRLEDAAQGRLKRLARRPRKTPSIFDNYRIVRPPALTWDQKARYAAIGRVEGAAGAGHDDVFVVSALFHHMSLLRIRVPRRLLDVLDGATDPELSRRSWGRVQAWRSPWFDLFDTEQRLAAMRLLWAMMAYQMREEKAGADVDAKMAES